jgi:hypothetical protein
MKQYYECHVTFTGDGDEPPSSKPRGWKFSRIDGDPDLGAGVNCYLTRHYPVRLPLARVVGELNRAARALSDLGYAVRRLKVELVVHDFRTGR